MPSHAFRARLFATVRVVVALAAAEGFAQEEAPRGRVIEEIVVTAERTEAKLHDVPISMSAFDDKFLRQEGVTDLQDLARFVPNVRIDFSGSQILPRIRGFSTNTIVNRGLELPVGIVIDEVPYSRADYFASGLFDLERVEVLRGAQGQLFGANTTVGLLNLTTKSPTDEYTGFADVQAGELDRRRFEAGVGGPIVPGFLRFRLSGLSDERDGYVKNTTARIVPEADDVFGDRLRRSLRAKLDFPNLLGASLLVTYQRDYLDIGATPRELTYIPQKFRALLRLYDPNVDFEPLNLVGSADSPSFRKTDIDILTARAHYDVGGWGLNLVAGWSRLKSDAQDDADSAPWKVATNIEHELGSQKTVELRADSPDLAGFFGLQTLFGRSLGSTDFTSGFFFQRRTLDPVKSRVESNGPTVLLVEVLSMLPGDGPVPAVVKPPDEPEHFDNRFEQTADELAGFGQMNWHLAPRWTLLYGMRLSHRAKNASTVQSVSGVVLSQGVEAFTNEDQRYRDFNFSPKVGLTYDWSDDVNLYWSWSTNEQSGGFNNFGTQANPATRAIEPAKVEDWEAGTKMRLLDGSAELNLGLFWMTMTNFQLFTLDTSGSLPMSVVVNVGELRVRGAEMDATWLPTQWLTFRGAVGFNDSELVKFPIGFCFGDNQNTDGDGDPRCDLSGGPLEQAPKWDASFTPSVRWPVKSIPGLGAVLPSLSSDVDLTSALTVQWTDTRFLNESLDPRTRQPSFFLLDGGVGLGSASQGWSVQVRVENITDERTANLAFESPVAAGMAVKVPSPPRQVYGGVRWQF